MLDRATSLLLEKIVSSCGEGGYKIIDESDLMTCAASDGEGVRRMIDYLQDNRYVDVRYAEEGVYCVRPLPEGKMYFERVREQRSERDLRRRDAALFSALGAFVGGLLGALLVYFVAIF